VMPMQPSAVLIAFLFCQGITMFAKYGMTNSTMNVIESTIIAIVSFFENFICHYKLQEKQCRTTLSIAAGGEFIERPARNC